jgi:hypothetical protein
MREDTLHHVIGWNVENLLRQWLAEFDLGSEIDGLVDTARNWVLFSNGHERGTALPCIIASLYHFLS